VQTPWVPGAHPPALDEIPGFEALADNIPAVVACIVCKVHAFRFAVPASQVERLSLFHGLDQWETEQPIACLDPLLVAASSKDHGASLTLNRTNLSIWLQAYKKPALLCFKEKGKTAPAETPPSQQDSGHAAFRQQSCRLLVDQSETLGILESRPVFPIPFLLSHHQRPRGLWLGCIVDTDGIPCPVINANILCTTSWLCLSKESV